MENIGAGTGPVQDKSDAVRHFFWSGIGLKRCGCRNTVVGASFLDADAQLWYLWQTV
jgi:hypothetical protein